MALDFSKSIDLVAVLAFDLECVDDLLNHPRCSSNPDILMAHGAVLVQNKPVLNTPLAE